MPTDKSDKIPQASITKTWWGCILKVKQLSPSNNTNSRELPQYQFLTLSVSLLTFSSTFDLLFKVLFTLSSLYFCTIGLPAIFSFRWDLPPNLGCNPKQPDSSKGQHVLEQYLGHGRDSHPLWCLIPKNLYPELKILPPWWPIEKLQFKRPRKISRFKIWAMSTSLAVTEDILVSFFSSA